MEPETDPCAACTVTALPTWSLLRCAGDAIDWPERAVAVSGLGDELHGHLPLCPFCLPCCRTCGAPVPGEPVASLLERLAREHSDVVVSWKVPPCGDDRHERPAQPLLPPVVIRDREGPPVVLPRSGWSNILPRVGDIEIGDRVLVDGRDEVGRLFQVVSHRLAGGLTVRVVFEDGTSIGCRPSAIRAAGPPTRRR